MWTRRRILTVLLSSSLGVSRSWSQEGEKPLRFGVIADPQYADVPTKGSRHYRASLAKLDACIEELNQHELAFTVTLGDLIDRDLNSFGSVLERYSALKSDHRVVLGNHDFDVAEADKAKVTDELKLEKTYRSLRASGWRIIFLDGTKVSTFRYPKDSVEYRAAEEMRAALAKEGRPNSVSWNGGIGDTQLEWFESELKAAAEKGEKVIVCCHFPALPAGDVHNLWDAPEVVEVIDRHPHVAAYFNGHNHAGNYAKRKHCHYVNFKGMVETATESAFATVTCYPDRLEIDGFGAEIDRAL